MPPVGNRHPALRPEILTHKTRTQLVAWFRDLTRLTQGKPITIARRSFPTKTTQMRLLYSEKCIIVTSTIFEWSTHVTDRQTDRRVIAYSMWNTFDVMYCTKKLKAVYRGRVLHLPRNYVACLFWAERVPFNGLFDLKLAGNRTKTIRLWTAVQFLTHKIKLKATKRDVMSTDHSLAYL